MIKRENRISGLGLLGILFSIALLCIVFAIFLERYIKVTDSKLFFRILIITVMMNIMILTFLIFSFSKIKTKTGPRGPTGIRGRRGFNGKYDTVQKCNKQSKLLGDTYIESQTKSNIVIQKPVLGFNDKY
jgi:membrane-bound ClpP family serine protease